MIESGSRKNRGTLGEERGDTFAMIRSGADGALYDPIVLQLPSKVRIERVPTALALTAGPP